MKRVCTALALVAFAGLLSAPVTRAADEKTIKGQVVDVKCQTDGKTGAEHDACAMSCAKRGQAAGVATADGVYVITGKYAENKNEKLIEFVNKTVEVTGTVAEKDGQKTIDASSIALAKAAK